jgi:isopenicillin N synthase-like dioxygenase
MRMHPYSPSRDFDSIPIIDVSALVEGKSDDVRRVDAAVGAACRDVGFFLVTGKPGIPAADSRTTGELLRFFDLPAAEKMKLARRRYQPENRNVYRGYYYPLERMPSFKEGIDLGVERGDVRPARRAGDILDEPNVWPAETVLPGWRTAMGRYAAEMEGLGFRLLHAIARHLGLAETWFDPFFRDGASTLRLLRYPPRTRGSVVGAEAETLVPHNGRRRTVMTAPHTDSGCLTLLHQDRVGGLQVRNAAGDWIDVPPVEDALVVNLGDLMQRWSGGAFRATQHRVLGEDLGDGVMRHSIPFFFEPSLDAVIGPIPGLAADAGLAAEPIRYGDYLLAKIRRFTEFRDLLPPG